MPAARFLRKSIATRFSELDIGRLRRAALAEGRAAVVRASLEIDSVVELRDHVGLAGAGHAADDEQPAFGHRLLDRLDQEGPHRLVAADDERVVDAGFLAQPALHRLRAQAAAKQ